NLKLIVTVIAILALGAGGVFYLSQSGRSAGTHDDHGHDEDHGHDAAEEPARGPHGGRLLSDGDFTLELAIFERGVPPEFRAWFSHAGQVVPPSQVRLSVELTRANGVKDTFTFTPEGDYARGH